MRGPEGCLWIRAWVDVCKPDETAIEPWKGAADHLAHGLKWAISEQFWGSPLGPTPAMRDVRAGVLDSGHANLYFVDPARLWSIRIQVELP